MISDHIVLGSSSAYLLNSNGESNLGGGAPSSARTPKLKPNQIWDISGLELLIEGDDLTQLLHLPDVLEDPLIEIRVQKEVFPVLFTNPFSSRIHNIAGFDDFERGKSTDCFVTEVNKIPTLVSRDSNRCVWQSVIYELPVATDFYAASWELATSRLVHEDQFEYRISLFIWHDHNTDRDADEFIDLANNTDADDARNYRFKQDNQPTNCHAFQLRFSAEVKVDSTFYQSHRMEFSAEQTKALSVGTIGIPLLRSIRLLEQVESSYRLFSLNELIQQAGFYQMFDSQDAIFKRLLVTLDISTVLVGRKDEADSSSDDYEYLELVVSNNQLSRIQAKLQVSERLRIPVSGAN